MCWLLIKRTDKNRPWAGSEIRYIKLSDALERKGLATNLLGFWKSDNSEYNARIVQLNSYRAVVRAFLSSKVIILHGGGPVLICLCLLAGVFGKRVVLDAYAPHWIELYTGMSEGTRTGIKIRLRMIFNLWRTVFCSLVFDNIIVGNTRQLDLVRGMVVSCGDFDAFKRVSICDYGADRYDGNKEAKYLEEVLQQPLQKDDFVIGWIGGLWDWLDIDTVLNSVFRAIEKDSRLKFVLFGISADVAEEIKERIPEKLIREGRVFLVPWVHFDQRLKVWSSLDAAIIWANDTIENDYAARTRNYDCLSLGMPIIQNQDNYWANIIESENIGIVTDEEHLEESILDMVSNNKKYNEYVSNIPDVAERYYWDKVVEQYVSLKSVGRRSIIRRLANIVAGIFITPFLVINTIISS